MVFLLVVSSFANFATLEDIEHFRHFLLQSNAFKSKYVATFSHILQTKCPFLLELVAEKDLIVSSSLKETHFLDLTIYSTS